MYTAEATLRTYARMAEIASEVQAAGYAVVLDATFLSAQQRAPFKALCTNTWIVSCEAPAEVLRERVRARYQAGTDAAEADIAVLERQLAMREALTAEELQHTIVIDTLQPFDAQFLAAQLRQKGVMH